MTLNHQDYTPQIDRGVAMLNEHVGPNWFDTINLDHLDLHSGRQCVLGQLVMTEFAQRIKDYNEVRYPSCTCGTCAGYSRVIDILKQEGVTEHPSFYGFELNRVTLHSLQDWEDLTIQWKEKIEKLRADAGTL